MRECQLASEISIKPSALLLVGGTCPITRVMKVLHHPSGFVKLGFERLGGQQTPARQTAACRKIYCEWARIARSCFINNASVLSGAASFAAQSKDARPAKTQSCSHRSIHHMEVARNRSTRSSGGSKPSKSTGRCSSALWYIASTTAHSCSDRRKLVPARTALFANRTWRDINQPAPLGCCAHAVPSRRNCRVRLPHPVQRSPNWQTPRTGHARAPRMPQCAHVARWWLDCRSAARQNRRSINRALHWRKSNWLHWLPDRDVRDRRHPNRARSQRPASPAHHPSATCRSSAYACPARRCSSRLRYPGRALGPIARSSMQPGTASDRDANAPGDRRQIWFGRLPPKRTGSASRARRWRWASRRAERHAERRNLRHQADARDRPRDQVDDIRPLTADHLTDVGVGVQTVFRASGSRRVGVGATARHNLRARNVLIRLDVRGRSMPASDNRCFVHARFLLPCELPCNAIRRIAARCKPAACVTLRPRMQNHFAALTGELQLPRILHLAHRVAMSNELSSCVPHARIVCIIMGVSRRFQCHTPCSVRPPGTMLSISMWPPQPTNVTCPRRAWPRWRASVPQRRLCNRSPCPRRGHRSAP